MKRSQVDRVTPSLIEMPEVRTARVATVALLQLVDKLYSYRIPEELQEVVAAGMRITVPFSRTDRPVPAFCIDVSERPWDSTLKPVIAPIDEQPLLSPKMLELGRWIARYYAAPLGRTLDLMVPAAAKRQAGWKKVRRAVLLPGKDGAGEKLTAKQAAVLSALAGAGGSLAVAECAAAAQSGLGVIQSLARKGFIAIETCLEPVLPKEAAVERREPTYELNADQKAAIAQMSKAVAARRFSVQVLFGVTGSGKTECYVATIRQALAASRQAIMLVPEIALTTQTVQRLQARFDRVATVHSGMSEVERSRTWAAVAAGRIPVVIGTRSAVFAPCPNLGVIVVDEEAEASYKNQASPRYHTRDIAVKRAQLEEIPVVLGSATPSLETWKNVRQKKHYRLIRLPHRVRGLAMPTMHLVDMRDEHKQRPGVHLLSLEMEARLRETLSRGEQAVLLLNRRGYANFLHCPRCKTVVTCPHCSVHMVFHTTTRLAHCHYCHARLAVPTKCQTAGCGGPLIKFGIGVQRVEEELCEKYPQARLRRVDSDVMQRSGDYAEVLGAFERKELDILVGTQMIAKGLDFPFVSFVGVVSADTALVLDDFRSEERTFQLVLQVAGRSGRSDVGGHVVVQTFAADTAPIRHAVAGDYEGFADAELAKRKRAKLPPHTRMMRIVLSDARMSRLEKAAAGLAASIRETLERRGIAATVLGPFSAPIARLRDKYRYDLQLVFNTATAMLSAIDLFKSEHTLQAKVKTIIVDVDPVSLQ
ncbi:MAG TPA: primosomal protein N' [Phycisphaerae bacterium]|nr:primosomal protein N' [Phycisphaerae bacterium]